MDVIKVLKKLRHVMQGLRLQQNIETYDNKSLQTELVLLFLSLVSLALFKILVSLVPSVLGPRYFTCNTKRKTVGTW